MKKGKVLVTGGCGFIGREVVKQLLEKDYNVLVVDDFSNSTPLKEYSSLQVINFDLTKSEEVLEIFKGIDYCIHLAARVGGINYMSLYQSEILRDNILIDINTISSASQTNTKIIYTSTVIVYDQLKEQPYKEDQIIFPPRSNYGFSKIVGERLCQTFGKDKDLKFSIARISNVYGINYNKLSEKKLHVIPDLIRKILRDSTLKLMGGGKQIRTFVHVSDIASALILMMESKSANGEIFNLASNDKYQILELAKIIWGLLKNKEPFDFESIDSKEEDFLDSSVDTSKINKLLGWEAKKSLKHSLPEIVKWYVKEYGTKAV